MNKVSISAIDNFSAKVALTSPETLVIFGDLTKSSEKTKALVELLRRVIRFANYSSVEITEDWLNRLGNGKYPEYKTIALYARYIESEISPTAYNIMSRTAIINKVTFKRFVIELVRNGVNRSELYFSVGLYLWYCFIDKPNAFWNGGKLVSYQIQDLYSVMNLSDKTVYSLLGHKKQLTPGVPINGTASKSSAKPAKLNKILQNKFISISRSFEVKHAAQIRYYTEREITIDKPILPGPERWNSVPLKPIPVYSNYKSALKTPENLFAKMSNYTKYFPPLDGVNLNELVPVIFESVPSLTIPLKSGAAPMALSVAFTIDEMNGLFKEAGWKMPSDKIRTIHDDASNAMVQIDAELTTFNRMVHNLDQLTPYRNTLRSILLDLSLCGIKIDVVGLNQLDIQAVSLNGDQEQSFVRSREDINQIISQKGELYPTYAIDGKTGRASTHHFPIHNLPNIFKQFVIPHTSEGRFVYFDIVANDLSMVINIAKDPLGIAELRKGTDLYSFLADKANITTDARSKAKAFMNPYLYGARPKTMIMNAGKRGLTISAVEIVALRKAFQKSFKVCYKGWLREVINSISRAEVLPGHLNPFGPMDVVIPRVLAGTVAPASIIQRYGTQLFVRILNILELSYGVHPLIWIHDGALFECPDSESAMELLTVIKSTIESVMGDMGIRALNVKLGEGATWKLSEVNAKMVIMH